MLPAGDPSWPQSRSGGRYGRLGRLFTTSIAALRSLSVARSSPWEKMSYSSHVTSVCPIQPGLTSYSLSLIVTLPGGSFTSVNSTTLCGMVILSLIVSGLAGASAEATQDETASAAPVTHRHARSRQEPVILIAN